MAEKRDSETKHIGKSLTLFERSLKSGFIEEGIAEELVSIIKKAQVHIASGHLHEADADLSAALFSIKRHLGTEISLRHGFVLSSILVEDVKRHIADPAILLEDAMDFAVTFFEILSQNKYRSGGLPAYLMKRPFPKGHKTAAAELIAVIKNFELPEEPSNTLISDIKAIELHAPAFAQGEASGS